jgi:8-oxo-dGTP diphosphatase
MIQDLHQRVLLLQRAPEAKMYRKYWEFPGGKLDGGEPVTDGLQREVLQESGLRISVGELLDFVESFVRDVHVIHLIFRASPHNTDIILSNEHCAYEWVCVDEVKERALTPYVSAFCRKTRFCEIQPTFDR